MGESATVKQDTAHKHHGVSYQECPEFGGIEFDFVITWDGEMVAGAQTEELACEIALAIGASGKGIRFFRDVQRGDVEAVRAELERNPHIVDIMGVWDSTALIVAAQAGDEAMVSLLIEFGADVEAVDTVGCTPLMNAVMQDRAGVLRLLIEAGADLEHVGDEEISALTMAVIYDRPELIDVLVAAGAEVDRELGGMTALDSACKQGKARVVERLLEAGADPNHEAMIRVNSKQFALQGGHGHIANMLHEAATGGNGSAAAGR